jgi:hypothetical protein
MPFSINDPRQFTPPPNLHCLMSSGMLYGRPLEAAWTVQISQHKTKLGGYLLTAVYINHNALAT